ncbi:FG-GAP-like repeat-containing protein [Fulvivirga lutea]|uniref:VCBS repeat-containing protein n=1 Tax=Fulvivirga lutea TaxID=2810512 RepID=A0A974WDY3_9BACT|nr:FG-GAP-like repeat-containing protein [Fulvivirga lutea]QSE96464.1 VCBS repeat-containing protein [Fulvivirga lutea]
MRLILFTAFISHLTFISFGQSFESLSVPELVKHADEDIQWIDIDGDDDLDLFISDYPFGPAKTLEVYQNNGGSFTKLTGIGLTPLRKSHSAWGDLNNDGYLDVVRMGIETADVEGPNETLIGVNNGDGTFTELDVDSEHSYFNGNIKMADFNNDGILDIILFGYNEVYKLRTVLYKNNGDLTFSRITTSQFPGLQYGNLDVGDYDKDGDIDFLLSGQERTNNSLTNYIANIYTNNGDWEFSEAQINLGDNFEPDFRTRSFWHDINNDGFLDILTVGAVSTQSYYSTLQLGSVAGFNFKENTGLPGIYEVFELKFSDLNNDGNADIVLSASFDDGSGTRIYYGDGSGNFNIDSNTGIVNYTYSRFALGDFDNDSKVDIATTGWDLSFQQETNIYKNLTGSNNSAPSAPTNLVSDVNNKSAELSWDASSDDNSGSSGLYYNIRIGTTEGGIEFISPNANLSTGYLQNPVIENFIANNGIILNDLPDGTYYWSVQSIDNGGNFSEFSTENTFIISSADDLPNTPSNLTALYAVDGSVELTWNDLSNSEDAFEIRRSVGANDNFELLEVLSANTTQYKDINVVNEETYYYELVASNISGNSGAIGTSITLPVKGFFSLSTNNTIEDLLYGSTSSNIIDYNNDGMLDIFILNDFNESHLYKNIDGENFELVNNDLTNSSFQKRSSNWGDINNDGFPDVFVTSSSVYQDRLYINNGDDSFTRIGESDFISEIDNNGSTFGDVNNDGFIDLYTANSSDAKGELFINNQNNTFTRVSDESNQFTNTSEIDASFIDVNNDLWPDLFGSSYFGSNPIYINDGQGNLELDTNNGLSEYSSATVGSSWADYDNDGDLDVLITNNVNGGDEFYENDGYGAFTYTFNQITQDYVGGSSSSWIDFDNDGYEDVVIVTDIGKVLYKNLGNKNFELIDENAFSNEYYSTSVSVGDINNDGHQDIYVTSNTQNELFINNGSTNNWLKVKLLGIINNKNAIGSKIQVIRSEDILTKEIHTNSGNDSQSSLVQHFGLAQNNTVDLRVFWPNNGIQTIQNVAANQIITIEEIQLLEAPTNLVSNGIDDDILSLSWEDNSINEVGFIIQKRINNLGHYYNYDTVSSNITTYNRSVTSENNLEFRVLAYEDNGYSLPSNTINVGFPPFAPSNLEVNIYNEQQLILTWNDNSENEIGFVLERSEVDNLNYYNLDTIYANSSLIYFDNNVVIGDEYFYRVRAYNDYGSSAYSNEVSDIPEGNPPIEPTNLILDQVDNTIQLTWIDNSDDEEGFIIYKSINNNSNYEPIDSITSNITTYSDADLTNRTTYFYTVYAYNVSGRSFRSNEASILTEFDEEVDDEVTSVDKALDNKIIVYPNPTIDGEIKLRYNFKNLAQYRVVNIAGQEVVNGTLSNSSTHVINLRNNSPGKYILLITDDKKTHIFSFILEK